MGCTEGLARIFVFVANVAFLLVGLALLIVGILYKVNFTKYTEAIPGDLSALQYVPVLAIVVGVIIFVIAFLGCCGTLKSNTCMLSWYGGILIVIFVMQIALGIFAIIQVKNETDLKLKISNQITTLFNRYSQAEGIVNLIQQNFKCCGTTGPSFWTDQSLSIPSSCYNDNNSNNSIFSSGCSEIVSTYISSSIRLIAIVALTVSVVEVAGAVLALCLAGCIRENRRQLSYH